MGGKSKVGSRGLELLQPALSEPCRVATLDVVSAQGSRLNRAQAPEKVLGLLPHSHVQRWHQVTRTVSVGNGEAGRPTESLVSGALALAGRRLPSPCLGPQVTLLLPEGTGLFSSCVTSGLSGCWWCMFPENRVRCSQDECMPRALTWALPQAGPAEEASQPEAQSGGAVASGSEAPLHGGLCPSLGLWVTANVLPAAVWK